MKRRHRSVVAVFVLGILGALAIGASSASAQQGTVPFRAFMPSGTQATLTGVPGAAAVAQCTTSNDINTALVGSSPGGIAKTWYANESDVTNPNTSSFQDDNFNINDDLPLSGGFAGDEVTGHLDFANREATRQLTAEYATEEGSDFQAGGPDADCAVWGSAVKVFGPN
jgi:hypothetical protein